MSQTLEALVVELRADLKGFQANLQSAAGDVARFNSRATRDVGNFQASLERARAVVLSLGVAWAAFRVGKGIVDAGIQMQALQSKMAAAIGNADVAASAFSFLREETERLGLDLRSTADGFASFSASALRSGLNFGEVKDIFIGVSEAATGLRLSAERTSLVFTALSQMASKQAVSMEELKQQMGESLPGALQVFAKAMGKSNDEFIRMIENGQVTTRDLIKLGQGLRKEFGQAAEEAAKGAQAAFNRLGNSLFELQSKMAESGFLDAVTNSVKELTTALNDPAVVEGLKGFASLLGDIVTTATKAASAIGAFYSEALSRRESYLAATEQLKGEGRMFVGVGELNERAEQSAFRQRILAQYKAQQDALAAARKSASSEKDGFSLGGVSATAPSAAALKAQEKAAREAERLREQLAQQAEGLRYQFASPEGKATMDVEKQQETLRKALDAGAILEDEYRQLSLEAEMEYQERLQEIRDEAREKELSAIEGFLGARFATESEIRNRSIGDQAKNFRDTIAQAANHNRAFFALEKAAAIARALISARESVVSAYAFGSRLGGPFLGAAFAGVAAAAQAANIAAIASTSFSGGGSSVTSSGSSGSGSVDQTTTGTGGTATASKSIYITLNGDDQAFYSKNTLRKLLDGLNDVLSDGSQLKIAVAS